MSTKRVVCPACSARLKLADGVEEGKRLLCPKCSASFLVPAANGSPAPAAKESRVGETHPEKEEEPEEQVRRRRKKRRKARELALPSDKPAKILFAASGFGVYAVCAVGLFFLVRYLGAAPEASAEPNAAQPGAGAAGLDASRGAPGFQGRMGQGRGFGAPGGMRGQEPVSQADTDSQPATSQELAATPQLFSKNCARCHNIGAGSGGRKRGPDLSRVGSNPDHTVDWLMAFIRDPSSEKPGTIMPAFGEEQISDGDLRALAEYLASLK